MVKGLKHLLTNVVMIYITPSKMKSISELDGTAYKYLLTDSFTKGSQYYLKNV
jgi:hypothetical protein